MPSINVDVDHSLEQKIALEKVKGLLNKLKTDYGDTISDLKEEWNDSGSVFSFKAMGMSVSGTLTVTGSSVTLDGQIPFTALPFKKMIENKIKEEALELLK